MGASVTLRRIDDGFLPGDTDMLVLGHGPGDPRQENDPEVARLRRWIGRLLSDEIPFLATGLSHQILCARLGLEIVQKEAPCQGVQQKIDLFGRHEIVGFYNKFTARSDTEELAASGVGTVQLSRNDAGEVSALRNATFAGIQFQTESVLTPEGVHILRRLLNGILESAGLERGD
ncbi:glutamine amidotransferase-related protein, partial [Nocardia gipuzkoensis]